MDLAEVKRLENSSRSFTRGDADFERIPAIVYIPSLPCNDPIRERDLDISNPVQRQALRAPDLSLAFNKPELHPI